MVRRFAIHACATLLFAGIQAGLAPIAVRADVAPADWREQASEATWQEQIRPAYFSGRNIVEGAAQSVVEIKAPYRAEDAAVVPISVHVTRDQTPSDFVRRIHVFIDKNPVPLVGVFSLTPDSGRADIAMRVRVDDFSFVRAVAETSSGELYLAKSFVRASGACSAPPPKSIDDSFANMGAMKLKTIGALEAGKPVLVQLMIKHPNITGLQPMEIGSRVLPPAHYINQLRVDYGGKNVMSADLTFSISMDPSLRFFFVPQGDGRLTVEATDTQSNHWVSTHDVGAAGTNATAPGGAY
jgi:sulfur-oxidizing protein SoxY